MEATTEASTLLSELRGDISPTASCNDTTAPSIWSGAAGHLHAMVKIWSANSCVSSKYLLQ